MRQSFRAKLLVMLSVVALGFGVLMVVSALVERQVERDLALIQERFIPLIALGPKLEQAFERLHRGLQDAVAAQDAEALAATEELKVALLQTLTEAGTAVQPAQARALSQSIEGYYALAFDVSRRLLVGESGDELPVAMRAMQATQAEVREHLSTATAFDHDGLARAFAEASGAQRTATRVRLVVSLASLGVVLILSFLISRGLLRSLSELRAGLARFGRGDFSLLIREQGDHELLLLAQQANGMAESLKRISAERDRQQEKQQQMNAELSARGTALETQHRILEEKNSELSEARRGLEQKAQELASVSSYKTQFLANMSHELRTPLNSMLVLSSLLADNEAGNLSAKQVEFCKTIHGAGTDLLALINQVLDLAKIEAGKQDVDVATLALVDLADYARRIFEPLARDKQLAFSVTVDPDLPAQIVSDRRRIEQILNNLLGNAIKFTERGKVSLRFRRPLRESALSLGAPPPESILAIEIEDTGAGIPREHQGRIFAAFEQLEGSVDRRYGGSGLGLSIARELATLLGGEIKLESESGRGSTFTCYLPFVWRVVEARGSAREQHEARGSAREQNLESIKPARPAPAAHAPTLPLPSVAGLKEGSATTLPGNAFAGSTILVADDDMRTLYALSALLHAKGAEVLVADTGHAALEELARQPQVNAVLLDMMMPEQQGYEALRLIREQARFAKLPVIALTAQAKDGHECLRRGANAHLARPIDTDDLCLLLHALLNSEGPPSRASHA